MCDQTNQAIEKLLILSVCVCVCVSLCEHISTVSVHVCAYFSVFLLTSNCASMAPLLRPSFSATMESLKACWSSWAGS